MLLALVTSIALSQVLIQEGVSTDRLRARAVPCMGKTLTAEGKPWPGATVWFEIGLPRGSEANEGEAPLQAKSDARGRFRVRLRADRTYLVHATGPTQDPTRFRVSPLTRFKATKRLVEITADRMTRPQIRILSIGLHRFEKDWKDLGPLRVRIVNEDGIQRAIQLLEGKDTILPALPGDKAQIQFLTKEGCVLLRRNIPLDPETREFRVEDSRARKEQQALPGSRYVSNLPKIDLLPQRDMEYLILPPSLTLDVLVVRKEDKEPIADAKVLQYSASDFPARPRRFVTDAEGRLRVRVPHETWAWGQFRQPARFDFLVRVPGREHSLAHFEFRLRRSPIHMPFDRLFAKDVPIVSCALDKGLQYRGRLLTPANFDASKIALRGWSSGPLSRSDDWVAFVRKPFEWLQPDKTGRFSMGGLGSDPESIRIDVALPPVLRKLLGSKGEENTPTQTGLTLRIDRLRNLETDFVDDAVDLTRFRYTDIEVRHATNEPASFAVLDLQSYPGQTHRVTGNPYIERSTLHCDRRGRCRLLIPQDRFQLLIQTESSWRLIQWDDKEEAPGSPWTIQLRTKPWGRGQVVDKQGQPIPGVWIQPIRIIANPDGEGIKMQHEGVRQASLEGDTFMTDQQGRFEFRYIPLHMRAWSLRATAGSPDMEGPSLQFQVPPKSGAKAQRLVLSKGP